MNPDQLKSLADAQFERSAYIKTLRESIRARLTVAHNGGLFNVNTELITFLSVRNEPEVFIEDVYSNPVKVRRQELLKQACQQYDEVMLDWYNELERSNKIRRGEHV